MKKKLLIALFIVALVCIFAFSVSAENEVTLTTGEKADLTTVFKVDSKNQVTGFNEGYSKNDVTDVIFPDYIVGLEANVLFQNATSLKTLTFAATDTFFISGDGIFSGCSVEKITFDPNCVVEIRKGNFSSCKKLTEITFPKFKVLTGSSFGYCENMKATNDLVFVEGMTELGGHAFHDCKQLTGTVVFPSTLTTIQEYTFQNSGFEKFDFSKCANLTKVGGGYGGPFTDCDSLTEIDMSGCVNLKDLKANFAADCDNLVSVILPPNLENIPVKAFAHSYKLQSIVLPASMKTIADEAFHSARRNQDIKTFTVYVQSNVQFGTKYYPFRDSSAKIEFVLIGDNVTVESFKEANTYTAITGDTTVIIDYEGGENPWSYVPGQAIASHTIVKNYCSALAINGEHSLKDNPCVLGCNSCSLSKAKENPIHNEAIIVTYANGYDKAGTKQVKCTNDGCTHEVTSELSAIFTCRGYSFSETDIGGISLAFSINQDAIQTYKSATSKGFSYGFFAVLKNNLADSDIIGNDGSFASKVLTTDLTERNYDIIEFKVTGMTTEEQKESKIALGVYIKDENADSTKYLQYGTPNENENYAFISYRDLVPAK